MFENRTSLKEPPRLRQEVLEARRLPATRMAHALRSGTMRPQLCCIEETVAQGRC